MSDASKKRKIIARHGKRGAWVKVILERGHELLRVQWKEESKPGISGTQSWPNTKENKAVALAWAEGKASQLTRGIVQRPRLTLRQVWELYATANFPALRERSQKLYLENFRRWAITWGWEFIAEDTTLEMADEFRATCAKLGLGISTTRKTIYDVKMVFAWAEGRELMQRNRLQRYRFKVAKEDRPTPIDEYRAVDFGKLLGQLDPRRGNNWRPYVTLGICGLQGARQHSVLHLAVADIRLGRHEITPDGPVWLNGELTWTARWDKTGTERKQPLRMATQILVEMALEWRERMAYTGPWLLPTGSKKSRRETYSPQSLWAALVGAEKRAGMTHVDRRAAHSLRRMLAGDVNAATGDFMLGLQAIGDSDPRMAARYIRTRQDRVESAFAQLDEGRADLPAANSLKGEISKTQRTRNAAKNETGAPEERPFQPIETE